MAQKDPKIEILETGSIPEGQLPKDAKVIEIPKKDEPAKKSMKDRMIEDINFLRGLHFSTDEIEKFGLIIVKVKQDLIEWVVELNTEEAKKNGNPNAE